MEFLNFQFLFPILELFIFPNSNEEKYFYKPSFEDFLYFELHSLWFGNETFTRLIKPYLLTDKTCSGMWYWYLVSVKPHLVCGIGIWYLILVLIEIYYSLSAASSFNNTVSRM